MPKTIRTIVAIAFAFASGPQALAAEETAEGPKTHWDLAFWGKERAWCIDLTKVVSGQSA